MAEEKLDLSQRIAFGSPEERAAAIAFFNAAFRAEESGLRQAHELSEETARWDPDLAECLKLYGDEEDAAMRSESVGLRFCDPRLSDGNQSVRCARIRS